MLDKYNEAILTMCQQENNDDYELFIMHSFGTVLMVDYTKNILKNTYNALRIAKNKLEHY